MGLTKLILRRPVTTAMLLISVLLFGMSSLAGFRLAFMPTMEMPTYIVFTSYMGADPEAVDENVTQPIEDIGKGLNGFTQVSSVSNEGSSMVILQFDFDVDSEQTYSDISAALDRVFLPEDASDPIIFEFSSSAMPVMTLSVSTQTGADTLLYTDEILVPALDAIQGVSEVSVSGGVQGYVSVRLKEEALAMYDVSADTVTNIISSSDFVMPIGDVDQGSQNINVMSVSSIDNLSELSALPVPTGTGNLLTVSDFADINLEATRATSLSRYMGSEDISINITPAQDADQVELAELIKAEVDYLLADNADIDVVYTYDASLDIMDSLVTVFQTMLISIALCMIVLFFFFGDLRASLIVGSSIPLSLLITLIAMSASGFDLNIVTATSLVIAIGMMVDNSIVVLESMFKVKETVEDYTQAALEGCRSVGASVTASTITTVVVYLPLAFVGGISGELFSELALTIIYAMIASVLSALTLVPLLFVKLKPVEKKGTYVERMMTATLNGYDKIIRRVINKKALAVIVAVLCLIGSGAMLTQIPIDPMPATSGTSVTIAASFKPGTKIEVIDEKISVIEADVAEDDRVESYSVSGSGSSATVTAYLKDDVVAADVELEYKERYMGLADMTVEVSEQSSMAMPSDSGTTDIFAASVTVSGTEYSAVKAAAEDMTSKLYEIEGVTEVQSVLSDGSVSLDIEVDPLLAYRYGTNSAAVIGAVSMATNGKDAGVINLQDQEYDIKVEYREGDYDTVTQLLNLPIDTPTGTVMLSEIAEVRFSDTAVSIDRSNGKYYIDLRPQYKAEYASTVFADIAELEAEAYYRNVAVGEEVTRNVFDGEIDALIFAIFISIYLVFTVMAIQFESPRFSFMVMTSVIYCFIGSVALLFIFNQEISMISLMGIMMLVGIAVNNGILFVDTTNQMRQEGMEVNEALVASGKLRMRPILMTTLTTILSMVPVSLGIGQAGEVLQSMGLVIIGGLLTSTILVLLLIPTFYLIIGKKDKSEKKPRRLRKSKADTATQ